MKIPAIVVVIGLVVVALVVMRSIVSTIKFSAKLMTWGIILVMGIGTAVFLTQNKKDSESPFEEVQNWRQPDNSNYR